METEKNRGGRPPRPGGQKVSTSFRADKQLVEDVDLIAKALGEKVSTIAERGLAEYRARHYDLLEKLREREN